MKTKVAIDMNILLKVESDIVDLSIHSNFLSISMICDRKKVGFLGGKIVIGVLENRRGPWCLTKYLVNDNTIDCLSSLKAKDKNVCLQKSIRQR